MKNLVKKIALPGAILAFAMALFGVSAYAGEQWDSWESIQGQNYIENTKAHINRLHDKVRTLNDEKKQLQNEKKQAEQERNQFKLDKEALESKSTSDNQTMQQLNDTVRQLNDQIKTKEDTIRAKEDTIRAKEDTIRAKEDEIKNLNGRISQVEQEKERQVGLQHNEDMKKVLEGLQDVQNHAKTKADDADTIYNNGNN